MSPSTSEVGEISVDRQAAPAFTAAPDRAQARATTARDAALDSLRAIAMVLVVAHHAVLAYAFYSPESTPRGPQPWLTGIPIVDPHRLTAFDVLALLDDTYLMTLMFFLSGLFVGPSMARKGSRSFLRHRAVRLGVPFVAAGLLTPIAYYPAYLLTSANPSALEFWQQWLSIGIWPTGPLWFIGLLLGFDVVVTALYRYGPGVIERLDRLVSDGRQRPLALFAVLMLASAVTYVPPRVAFGPDTWIAIGIVPVQACRVFHYLVYFLAAVAIGDALNSGVLATDGRLVQRWYLWVLSAVGLFAAYVALFARLAPRGHEPLPLGPQLILGVGYVICCGTISFAVVATFRRFAQRPIAVLAGLSRNSYGIYLTHYFFVMWLQYVLLPTAIPPAVKAAIVLAVGLAASWITSAALRRIPAVGRVI